MKLDRPQPDPSITHHFAVLFAKVNDLRRRTLALALLRGASGGLWIWLGSLLALGGVNLLWPIPAPVRLALLILHGAAVIAGTGWAAGKHIFNNRDLRAWALRCEELHPLLNKQLVTCVEMAAQPEGEHTFATSPVAYALLTDTVRRMNRFDVLSAIPQSLFQQYKARLALAGLTLLMLAIMLPHGITPFLSGLYRYKIPVFHPAKLLAAAPRVEALTVRPGNVEVPRGTSLTIAALARMNGPNPPEQNPRLDLLAASGPAQPHEMIADTASTPTATFAYKLALHELREPVRYQVTALRAKSPVFTIKPYDAPRIESILTSVTAPAYLRQPVRRVNGASITAPTSSSLAIRIRADHPITAAHLSAEDGATIPAQLAGKEASFAFELKKTGAWRLELTDEAGHPVVDPPLLQLRAEDDNPPTVHVKRPGADWSIHPSGEVILQAEAEDDHQIEALTLEYRINGGALTTHTLYAAPAPTAEAQPTTQALTASTVKQTAQYEFNLEAMGLKPGDAINYRFLASDGQPDAQRRWARSQPYFITLRPYAQDFYKGGPGTGNGNGFVIPSQKQVIVATTRLAEAPREMSAEAIAKQYSDTVRAQRAVRQYVMQIRNSMRAANDIPDQPARLEHLEQGLAAMEQAEDRLGRHQANDALAPENAALAHVNAALAGLPLYTVWNANNMGSPFAADPRMNLLGQKLDVKKDKYELMDRSSAGGDADQKLVEALEKIRAIAHRQREFNETIKREKLSQEKGPGEGSGSGGGGGNASPSQAATPANNRQPAAPNSPQGSGARMEQMRRDAEESRNQLERLRDSLQEVKGLDQESFNALRRMMSEAAGNLSQMDEALSAKDLKRAEGASTRASEQLQELELKLGRQAGAAGRRASLEQLSKKLDEWGKQQAALKAQSESLGLEPPSSQQSQGQALAQQQSALAQAVSQAMAEAVKKDATGGAALAGVTKPLTQAADWMRQAAADLEKGDGTGAAQGQEAVMKQLEATRQAIEQLQRGGDSLKPADTLAQALETVRAMRQAMSQSQAQGQPGPQGKEGKDGKDGQGQGQGQAKAQAQNASVQTGQQSGQQPGQQSGQQGQDGTQGQGSTQPRQKGGGGGGEQIRRPTGEIMPLPPIDQTRQASSQSGGRGVESVEMPETVRLNLTELHKLTRMDRDVAPVVQELILLSRQAEDRSYTPAKRIEVMGQLGGQLARLEELLQDKLDMADQLQRLEQTPDAELPERFRTMAAKYFEILGATRAGEPAAK